MGKVSSAQVGQGAARQINRWRIITLSTGERTLGSIIMNEVGKRRPNAGQLVRLLSIPVTFEYGAFSELHGFESGRALADHLKVMRMKHYGHIGPAFIRQLMLDKRDFRSLLDVLAQKLSGNLNTSLEKRAATTFAIIGLAGELAIEYQLLPWEKGNAFEAALIAFKRYQAYLDFNQSEDGQILQAISDFIAKHGDSRFSALPQQYERMIQNRAGWYKDTDQGRVYMFFSSSLKEAGSGFERVRVVEALKKAKWIVDHDVDRLTKKTRTSAGLKNLYHICEPNE